jgi:spore germination protein KA
MIGDLKRFYRAMRLKAAEGNMNAEDEIVPVAIPQTGAEVLEKLQDSFNGSSDFKAMVFGENTVIMAFLDGMVDKLLISTSVIEPIKEYLIEMKTDVARRTVASLGTRLNSMCVNTEFTDFNECVNAILSGGTLIFADGDTTALCLSLQKFEKRPVKESDSEAITRGSREAFTEVLKTNITLLRRIIKDSCLVFENITIGRQTKTNVAFCYIKGLANQEIIDEVRKRLKNIKTQAILESGYLEGYIEDSPFSVFPTVFNSERPDTAAGKLLEGRVAILCDGTPVVMTVPNLFVDYLQFSEDYNNRWLFSTIIRPVRLLALFISTLAPAFYIALLCFHQDIIPFKLLLTINSSLKGVPLPPLIEMLVLTILFEIIKESGLRMSRALGQSVSIVGGLIIGEAAVQAGIFSTAAVVVIAATSISAFIISKLDATVFIMRITLMVAASSLGILGISLCSMVYFIYACALKSFGVPYLSPITPLCGKDMKDTFIRIPIWAMLEKPETITRRYVQKDPENK